MAKKIKIKAYLQDGCPPCINFKKNIAPHIKSKCSLKIINCKNVSDKKLDKLGVLETPTFFVEKNGKTKRFSGDYSLKEFENEVER